MDWRRWVHVVSGGGSRWGGGPCAAPAPPPGLPRTFPRAGLAMRSARYVVPTMVFRVLLLVVPASLLSIGLAAPTLGAPCSLPSTAPFVCGLPCGMPSVNPYPSLSMSSTSAHRPHGSFLAAAGVDWHRPRVRRRRAPPRWCASQKTCRCLPGPPSRAWRHLRTLLQLHPSPHPMPRAAAMPPRTAE